METNGNKGLLGKGCALGILLAWALGACAGGSAESPPAGNTVAETAVTAPADSGHWQLVEFFAVA